MTRLSTTNPFATDQDRTFRHRDDQSTLLQNTVTAVILCFGVIIGMVLSLSSVAFA